MIEFEDLKIKSKTSHYYSDSTVISVVTAVAAAITSFTGH
jgi:hypothetical protein